MKDQEKTSAEETRRKENLKAEEAEQAAKDQARRKIYQARELEIEKGQKARETRQGQKRAFEDVKDLAREKLRKETYLAQEKKRAGEQDARRAKERN